MPWTAWKPPGRSLGTGFGAAPRALAGAATEAYRPPNTEELRITRRSGQGGREKEVHQYDSLYRRAAADCRAIAPDGVQAQPQLGLKNLYTRREYQCGLRAAAIHLAALLLAPLDHSHIGGPDYPAAQQVAPLPRQREATAEAALSAPPSLCPHDAHIRCSHHPLVQRVATLQITAGRWMGG